MNNKAVRLPCIILTVVILASSLFVLSGCEDSEIYGLISDVSNIAEAESKGDFYSFDADIICSINTNLLESAGIIYYFQDSLEVVPEELEISIKGNIKKEPLEMAADIVINNRTDELTSIYIKNGELFFELNASSRIIADMIYATGMTNMVPFALFNKNISYTDGSILCFDVTDFDLSYFDDYILYSDEIIKADSAVKYGDGKDFTVPERDEAKTIYFEDVKRTIEKEMLTISGYRYAKLSCVMTTKDGKNYIDIVAEKENGDTSQLERVQIDSDLSTVRENPELFENAEILPLRYIFELLGKRVEWDEATETVSVADASEEADRKKIDSKLIGERTYMSIKNIELFDYSFESVDIGEYIEFAIILDESSD